MSRNITFLFLLTICISCNSNTELTKDFSFLEGSWKMVLDDSTYILESWEKVNDQHYTALNYVVSDTGMQLSEEIEIDITDSGTFYKPTIEGLNGGVAFSYRFVSQENEKYVFENEAYDFPRRIWYKTITARQMEAGIESETGDRKQNFVFEKVEQ